MASNGQLHGYVFSNTAMEAISCWLNLIDGRDKDWNTDSTGGCAMEDGTGACAVGAEWCAMVLDAEWFSRTMNMPMAEQGLSLTHGAGKSRLGKETKE